ncbi:hypothetical protein EV652_11383 [Kribbella steppae]|uniref:MFS transporter n=1 Tax=Kribbella steppae TaxID=2512223 RepID=A0A4R2H3F6_9ACTN|nr:hypothetical protein EV652_11383 [Kribbella steppae]
MFLTTDSVPVRDRAATVREAIWRSVARLELAEEEVVFGQTYPRGRRTEGIAVRALIGQLRRHVSEYRQWRADGLSSQQESPLGADHDDTGVQGWDRASSPGRCCWPASAAAWSRHPTSPLSLQHVPVRMAGAAGGALQTAQRIGGAVGTAVFATIFYRLLADSHHNYATTVPATLLRASALMLAALCIATTDLVIHHRRR